MTGIFDELEPAVVNGARIRIGGSSSLRPASIAVCPSALISTCSNASVPAGSGSGWIFDVDVNGAEIALATWSDELTAIAFEPSGVTLMPSTPENAGRNSGVDVELKGALKIKMVEVIPFEPVARRVFPSGVIASDGLSPVLVLIVKATEL